MKAYWQVLIQAPNLDATEQLAPRINTSYADASKFYKPQFFFDVKQTGFSLGMGEKEYDVSQRVRDIVVEQSDRKADMAKIVMADHDHYLADNLETGLLVTVIGGWDKKDSYGVLFEGLIHTVTPSYRSGQRSTMTITCLEKMIVMGVDEVDMVNVTEAGEEDEDSEESSAETGSYADIIIATARRNGLQCDKEDVTLVPPFPRNQIKSPEQTAKATDLAHLFKLAKALYAAMWVEGDRLKFSSLTKIYDDHKPELTFVYRDISNNDTLSIGATNDDLFETASTKKVFIEEASVNKGRPRKKVKVAAADNRVAGLDVKGAPKKDKDGNEIYYIPDYAKIHDQSLSSDRVDELRELFYNASGTLEWATTKQWLVAVKIEHVEESKTVEGTNKIEVAADARELNIGVDMKCTAGYWGARPVTMAKVRGLGKKYSGLYYIAEVSHDLSAAGYKCSVKALKIGEQKPVKPPTYDGPVVQITGVGPGVSGIAGI